MPEFTSGPWRIRNGSVVYESPFTGHDLLIVSAGDIHANPYNDNYEAEQKANATLMAASWDMYMALTAFLRWVNDESTDLVLENAIFVATKAVEKAGATYEHLHG